MNVLKNTFIRRWFLSWPRMSYALISYVAAVTSSYVAGKMSEDPKPGVFWLVGGGLFVVLLTFRKDWFTRRAARKMCQILRSPMGSYQEMTLAKICQKERTEPDTKVVTLTTNLELEGEHADGTFPLLDAIVDNLMVNKEYDYIIPADKKGKFRIITARIKERLDKRVSNKQAIDRLLKQFRPHYVEPSVSHFDGVAYFGPQALSEFYVYLKTAGNTMATLQADQSALNDIEDAINVLLKQV